jgi:PKD repeat protein
MGKITIKKTLAILLAVLFVATVTAASVSAAPVASATGTVTGKVVKFSSAGSTGDSLTFDWDFGDGTTSTASNPTHVYTANTIHTIRLTVTDNVGASDITTITR